MAQQPIIPEILEPEENLPPDLRALQRLALLLDAAIQIPGMRRKVGLAPAIGLVPGVGDVVGALLSTWIVVGALRHRVPTRTVLRMLFNVLTDLLVGSIPVIGDVFDFLFQENLSNVRLLLESRDRRREPRTFAQLFLLVVLIIVVLGIAAIGAIAIAIVCVVWILSGWL